MAKKKTQKKQPQHEPKKKTHVKKSKASASKALKSNIPTIATTVLIVAIVAFLIIMALRSEHPTPPSSEIRAGAAVFELYVMSYCPYGVQAENAVIPALAEFGGDVDLQIEFIVTETATGFQSLHGQNEVDENIIQLCAIEQHKQKALDYILCRNKNILQADSGWETCANQVGLDLTKLKACAEGSRGKELLSASGAKANANQVSGSPTMFINGESYMGPRDKLTIQRAVCEAMQQKASLCSALPEPEKVELYIVSDERCKDCDVEAYIVSLRGMIPGLEVHRYDYGTAEGKAFYEQVSGSLLPAMYFANEIETASDAYAQLQSYLSPAGDYLKLAIQANFDPEAEICDNQIDDNGNGLVDCEDADCLNVFECAKRAKPSVELFIMSHCPYGTQTMKGILPAVELLDDNIDFKLRFVSYAMHGEIEIYEQLRMHCIQEQQQQLLLPYLKCFLEEGKSDECIESTGVDAALLEACEASADAEFSITANFENKDTWLNGRYPLFEIDMAENEKYSIRGSPGLAINEVGIDSFGRSPAQLKELICTGFAVKPAECETPLSADSPTPGFGWESTPADQVAATGSC
jgi:hypothetical protein